MSAKERLAKVEGRLEELSKRIDDLNHSMSRGFEALNKRIDDLRNILVAIMVCILASVLGVLFKLITG
ncbi:MAG: hypothetical protein AOA66_1322 [Candidatus Bathyarchaeota archaeon BA2]|nr:MAG: hypothetical protein AOA66_1322 [Candidatus Bathyarchaeota archaeon BA2]